MGVKFFVLSLACLVTLTATVEDPGWDTFKQEYGKKYEDVITEEHCHAIWKSNLVFIEEHNSEADKHGYTLGMNEYGDLTATEFSQMLNGYKMQPITNSTWGTFEKSGAFVAAADVDWRAKGAVTEVKNQGQCGSCWSFSATGSLEGQHFLKTGQLITLSEQNLIDCSTKDGNHGCEAGMMDNAFRYIIENNGIDTEMSYPYQAHDEFCRFNASSIGATMSSHKDIKHEDVTALTEAVGTIGPISVAMDASRPTFHLYRSGVYKDRLCSSTKLNHGVLAVGYGTYQGKPYFLVKNSVGRSWGEEGYFMILRDSTNMCGLATRASYPIV